MLFMFLPHIQNEMDYNVCGYNLNVGGENDPSLKPPSKKANKQIPITCQYNFAENF